MGQIIDNLNNNINIPKPNDALGTGTHSSWHNNISTDNQKDDIDSLLGYKFTKEKDGGYLENTTMKNFEEYLQNRQEKMRRDGQDAASEEAKEKENEKEVARSLSSEEIKRLKLMGVDVEGASMSDLMGMVNTMRHNAHKEEQQNLMAAIALSKGDTDGMTVIGGAAKMNGVEVDVDIASVNQAKLDEALDNKTKDISEEFTVNNSEIIYLLHNEMPVNTDNLYKAHFSGTRVNTDNITDEMFAEMKPQVEKVIEQAGFSVDDESLNDAKLLINNDIPVTTDNIRRYEELKQSIGKEAGEVLPEISDEVKANPAKKLMEDIESINPDLVYDMAKQGKELTVAAAVRELSGADTDGRLLTYEKDLNAGTLDAKAVTARRQMEEIRLSMTMEVSVRMTSLDVNVDTRELSKFVNMLRDLEKSLLGDAFKNADVEFSDENILAYNEITAKVSDIAAAPASILASPLKGGEFSINSLHAAYISERISYESVSISAADGKGLNQSGEIRAVSSFETVARSYEAVGTAPRFDMGDSISKAFNNVDDILSDMEMPVNNETQRAVRILGYNRIEITESNINEVINYDRQVNELINNLYPEAVLGLIKDNINPMDVSIEDLNKTIRSRRYNEGVSEAEDFASYLRDMESRGEVSTEERESYIGIYRMMNKLAKSGDREAGWLFANSSRLTVRNLLSAMRSRKNAGVDVSVDDSFGVLSEISVKGSRIDTQIETAFNSEPDMSPDNEELITKDIERFEAIKEEVEEFIKENNIEYSMVNAFAVDTMINTPGGIYQLVSEILANMNFNADKTSNLVDEETENMTDSMTGEEVDIDLSQFETDSILESLKGSEEMSLKYDDLRNQITEMMYRMGAAGRIGSLDIASIKTVNAGFNIMSNMAKQEHFQIPVRTGDGINVINLKIEHDSERRGSINISMADTYFGNIAADINVSADKALSGHIVSDTSDGNSALAAVFSEFTTLITGGGYDASEVTLGSVSFAGRPNEAEAYDKDASEASDNDKREAYADERTLYEAAVLLVRGLAGISG